MTKQKTNSAPWQTLSNAEAESVSGGLLLPALQPGRLELAQRESNHKSIDRASTDKSGILYPVIVRFD